MAYSSALVQHLSSPANTKSPYEQNPQITTQTGSPRTPSNQTSINLTSLDERSCSDFEKIEPKSILDITNTLSYLLASFFIILVILFIIIACRHLTESSSSTNQTSPYPRSPS